jgi:hypothetical protein
MAPTPTVQLFPIVMRSDLNALSSCEWHWIHDPALRVTLSPRVTRFFSAMLPPSSKSLRPTRTPSSRKITPLNGVPLKTRLIAASNLKKRSSSQKSMSQIEQYFGCKGRKPVEARSTSTP